MSVQSTDADQPAPPRVAAPRKWLRRRGLFLVGALLGLAAGVWWFAGRGGLEGTDRAQWEAAEARWRREGPLHYDIEVRVTGVQAAEYRVEVRDGEAVRAWRNGAPLRSSRTFPTWSVPGMFETIARDLDTLEEKLTGRSPGSLRLWARFDPVFGYPQSYLRVEHGGLNMDASWEVLDFQTRRSGDGPDGAAN